jgi:hypothetical protein
VLSSHKPSSEVPYEKARGFGGRRALNLFRCSRSSFGCIASSPDAAAIQTINENFLGDYREDRGPIRIERCGE